MKCPSCLSTMENWDERHQLGKGMIRMNLHCRNDSCPNRNDQKSPYFSNFVQVRCPVDIWSGPWEMMRYGFQLYIGAYILQIHGELYWRSWMKTNIPDQFKIRQYENIKGGTIPMNPNELPSTEIEPILLSTGDHMHEEVWTFVRRYYDVDRIQKLAPFA